MMNQVIIDALNTLIQTRGILVTFNHFDPEQGWTNSEVQQVSLEVDHPERFQIHTAQGVFLIRSTTVTPFEVHLQ